MAFLKAFVTSGLLLSASPLCEAQQPVSPQVAVRLKTPLKQTKVTDCGAAARDVRGQHADQLHTRRTTA